MDKKFEKTVKLWIERHNMVYERIKDKFTPQEINAFVYIHMGARLQQDRKKFGVEEANRMFMSDLNDIALNTKEG